MSTLFSFFGPLFCWTSYGARARLSPANAAQRFRRFWFDAWNSAANKREIAPTATSDDLLELKWRDRDSFFDQDVQAVLTQRHPSQPAFEKNGFKGYPIDAWRVAEQFARTAGASERSLAEFGVFMGLDPLWISKLLAAVAQAQENHSRDTSLAPLLLAAENRRRGQIMQRWAECWIAHYRFTTAA